MKIMELNKASLTYSTGKTAFCALQEISLAINEGEFLTIVGPSGCGKSSLLGLLAGTHRPTRGEALYQGRPIAGPSLERGILLQQAALFPWLSASENVAFGLKMQGVAKAARREMALDLLRKVGLESAGNRHTYELSGGMKQRVALARTLITNPAVILMDEPLAALDAFTKRKMHELFSKVWKESGKTFVMVTHDVDEAVRLGTKMIVMGAHPGRVNEVIEWGCQDTEGMDSRRSEAVAKVFASLRREAGE